MPNRPGPIGPGRFGIPKKWYYAGENMKGDSQPIDARTWMTTEEMQPYEKAEERAENPPPSIRHQAQCL